MEKKLEFTNSAKNQIEKITKSEEKKYFRIFLINLYFKKCSIFWHLVSKSGTLNKTFRNNLKSKVMVKYFENPLIEEKPLTNERNNSQNYYAYWRKQQYANSDKLAQRLFNKIKDPTVKSENANTIAFIVGIAFCTKGRLLVRFILLSIETSKI